MPKDRPVPESFPRQKAYTYIFLIGLTCFFLYFYSYPLDAESWIYIKQKFIHNVNKFGPSEDQFSFSDSKHLTTGEITKFTASIILQTIFSSITEKDIPTKSRRLKSTEVNSGGDFSSSDVTLVTESISRFQTIFHNAKEKGKGASAAETKMESGETRNDSANKKLSKATLVKKQNEKFDENVSEKTKEQMTKINHTADHMTEVGTLNTTGQKRFTSLLTQTNYSVHKTQEVSTRKFETTLKPLRRTTSKTVVDSLESNEAEETLNVTEDIEKRYLVFSEHCRIPDIDPMHPSIAHLISKTPPLDCSEGHEPLTRTEGHVLFLNTTAVLERTSGDNYTCCYKSVFREKEGQSDNDVGFSKECIPISNETVMKDEFIEVECKLHSNGTTIYKEFHSFVFDKPKVEKRCGNSTTEQSQRYSVLIIGVDAVSRLNMHRQLNATAEYLLREMDATEMYGFNKVGDNTFPNLIPLLMGYDERELPSVCWKSQDLPLDRCNFVWKLFAKKGYRTLYAEDSPTISTFNYVKNGFYLQPTDYYFRPFILAYEDALRRDKPLNCYLCVGSTSETEAVLHWTRQFASHFATRPYFAFSWINSVTHDFLNTGSSVDHVYENFFRTLHETGALDRTVVILMGDHGMRWGEIRHTYVGRLEERLPMLMISLPKKFKQEHPEFAKALKENSRRLVTPFDLHASLAHLLDLKEDWTFTNTDDVSEELSNNFTSRAFTLFRPVPEERSCDDAYIEEHWCTCESSVEVDIQEDNVKHVAQFILDHINNLLEPASSQCALLKLDSISDARLWQPPAEHEGHSADDNIYTAVIQTSPGSAVFEGTVKVTGTKADTVLLGTISRLNLYGNQSSCIEDTTLKKYCYCL